MRLSLRLTAFFSLFGLAIAGGFQINHIRSIRRESYARALNMAEVTSVAVRALVEDQANSGNFGLIGRNLEELVRQSGIATIVVKDRKGRRLVGRSDDAVSRNRRPHPGVPIDRVSDGVYDVERAVDLGPRGRGTVEVGFHTTALEERLRDIGSSSVRLGVMAFLAITLLAWLLGAWFGHRIERLVPRIEALPRDPEGFRPLRTDGYVDEVARLVSAFNRMALSLKAETQRRRELESEKEELSAMLVHDLKTPLTVIRSGIALLQEQLGESDGREASSKRPVRAAAGTQQRTFELLGMSASRLQRMVEDVLQLARLEEVAGLRERVLVDLVAMVRACARDFEIIVAERRQRLVLEAPKSAPRVLGDPALLRRVLDNLLYNAVEHTPPGGSITLGLSVEPGCVRVNVADAGPGVPPEARADIFRKFYQKDVKRHVGNVGLGLALCEKVILRHEGVIGIEDAKHGGACFYVTLPSAEPALPL